MSEPSTARGLFEFEIDVIEMPGYWLLHLTTYYPYPNRASSRYVSRDAAYDHAIQLLQIAKMARRMEARGDG